MHPTHVPIVNRVYTPTADELAFDKGLLQAIGYFVIVLRVRSAAPRGDYAWPRGPGNLNATGNRANGVNITGADGSAFPTSCIGSP